MQTTEQIRQVGDTQNNVRRIRLVVQLYDPEKRQYRNLAIGRFDLAPGLDPEAVGAAILRQAPSAADLLGL